MCDQLCWNRHGVWLADLKLCRIDLFPKSICIRVKPTELLTWIVDDRSYALSRQFNYRTWKLPANKQLKYYDSDDQGCSYANNWNSVEYGFEKLETVPVYVCKRCDILIEFQMD